MSRKALGRGISALIGDTPAKTQSGEELLDLDLDLIRPNAEQPRTRFAEDHLEELAASIRANGIVQPIVVRRVGASFEIVAGERRWRASQRAGLQKIPAVVKEVADERLLEIALVENIQRQELNPIEEAKAYKKLLDTVGLTQENLSERIGKSRTVIATFLRFLRLPDDIQKLVEEEKLSAGHARALLTTDDASVQRTMAKKIIESGISVRETEKAVKRAASAPKTAAKKTSKPKVDANMRAAETKMRRHLATNVHIVPDGKGTGGRIEIEYYGEADLDRIYNLILGKK